MLKCRFKSSPLLILEVSSSSFCAILTFFSDHWNQCTQKTEKWDKKNSFWIAETGPIWFSLSTFQAQCKAKGNNCLKVFPGNAKMKLTFRSNFIFSLLLCCTEWGLLLTWQNKAKIRQIFNKGYLIYNKSYRFWMFRSQLSGLDTLFFRKTFSVAYWFGSTYVTIEHWESRL